MRSERKMKGGSAQPTIDLQMEHPARISEVASANDAPLREMPKRRTLDRESSGGDDEAAEQIACVTKQAAEIMCTRSPRST